MLNRTTLIKALFWPIKPETVKRWLNSRYVILGFAALVVAVAALAAAGIVHPDWYPQLQTYGVSIGSNSHYCFAELVRWHPSIGCEASR